jgi:hypothetical protein
MSLNDNNFVITTDIHNWEIVRSEDPTVDGQWMRVVGWASDTSRDKRDGIVYPEAIERMVRIVKDRSPLYRNIEIAKAVQVDVDHSNRYDDQIGYLEDAQVVNNVPPEALAAGVKPPVMQVTMMVDLEMPAGKALKRSLEKGYKLGLSVFGKVLKGYKQMERSTGKVVEHFLDVALEKVAVTSQPVNPNTWVATIARSMNGVEMEETVIEQEAIEGEPIVKSAMDEILETLDAEENAAGAEVTEEVARSEEAVPADESNADVLEWAQAHPEIVRSLMTVSDEVLTRAMEGMDEKEMPDCKPRKEDMPMARSEEVQEENPDITLLVRSLFTAELESVKTLLEPLADFVERSERADADLLEANAKLTEELTQIKSDMEVLRSEVDKIGGESTGLRHTIARSLQEEFAQKPVEELPVVWDDVPKEKKLDALRDLNQKDPIKATQIVLKMLRDPGAREETLTPEARKLAQTPA